MKRTQRGMVLIDVLASLVLLGGVVVALLTAQRQAIEQLHASQYRTTAARLASELRAEWRLNDADVRRFDAGTFTEEPGWSWSRSVAPMRIADGVEMLRVRLEILRQRGADELQTMAAYEWLKNPVDVEP